MSGEGSVTHWIHEVRSGAEGDAQQQLWERYFGRVVALARAKLGSLRGYEDEEDIAISAMKSFFMRASRGRFPRLSDRTDLWPLLVKIAVRKTADAQRRLLAGRRDVRRATSLEEVLVVKPTLEVVERLRDETNQLLDVLEDESLRAVARLKLQGYGNIEIAERIGRSVKTVERKLALIRVQLSELGSWQDG
jgi:DNA-directed RNA polymerase specialized sigma24 family protein